MSMRQRELSTAVATMDGLRGLSQQEAARRRAEGLNNVMPIKSSRSYWQIFRENVFAPINNVLFVLGAALIALGRISDALISVSVILLNVVVSVVQEIRAKRQLDRIALLTRPQTRVVRDSEELQLDPAEIVVGDVLLVRPGDQVVVDGPILRAERIDVDESQLTGESELVAKKQGDWLYSGSFCVNGSASYQAEHVGEQSTAYKLTAGARAFRRVYTPLQSQINLVIRVILLAAVLLEVLVLLNALTIGLPLVEFVRNSVVVVGIVPKGLFLSITVAYALGAVRILGSGALVQQANAVESLSHVDVLCMDKTGTLTTNTLQLTDIYPLHIARDELSRLLGDFVASGSVGNATSAAIGAAFSGAARRVREELPFSSVHKWSGLALDDDGMHGIYILGAVEVLEPALAPHEDFSQVMAEQTAKGLRILLFAYYLDLVPLRDDADRPALPAGLRPLGLVCLRDQLRPQARETLTAFTEAGIQLKIISGDNPQTVAALAKQAGLPGDPRAISGLDLAQMEEGQFARAAEQATIFGRITPQQKEQLVRVLRGQGHYVAMIGDGVNDVLSLKQANLGVAMQSGSQATRGVADIVLLKDSFSSLPPAFREGQRIRNGMQSILKLFMTRVLYVFFLLIGALCVRGFPFAPKQVSLLVLFTVGIPSLAFSIWARPGATSERSLRSLWHFVLPAATTLGIMALLVYVGDFALSEFFYVEQPGLTHAQALLQSQEDAQSSLTTFALFCGVVLLLFVEPPSRFWTGGSELRGDRYIVILALAMLAGYVVVLAIPPLRRLFELQLLGLDEYAVILACVVIWIFLVRWVWRAQLMRRLLTT